MNEKELEAQVISTTGSGLPWGVWWWVNREQKPDIIPFLSLNPAACQEARKAQLENHEPEEEEEEEMETEEKEAGGSGKAA